MESFEDNIEKEYHERFQDFEEMPDDAVWSKIQERIAPEPERRPIVFWWNNYRSMGIAASVLLGLTVGGYLFSTYYNTGKQQTISEKTQSTQVGEKKKATQAAQRLTENSTKFPATTIEKQPIRVKEKQRDNKSFFENKEVVASLEQEKPSALNEKLALDKNVANQLMNTENSIVVANASISKQENVESVSRNSKSDELPNEIKIPEKTLANVNIPPSNAESAGESTNNDAAQAKLLTTELAFLTSKSTDIRSAMKELKISEITHNEPVFAFEEPRRERLVFIPPTEIYANVSPMLNYYVFSPNRTDNFVVKDFNSSSDRLSFAAQLGIVYPLTKKIDIRTGLSFMAGKSNFSYGITNNNQKVVKVIDELNIELQPTSSVNIEQRNWQYLEIQSDLLYSIKRLHAVSVGFRAGVQTSALNKPVFNGRVGYRISKPVNNRVALWLEPSVVLSLSSQQSLDNHFLYRTTGFSLNVGASLLRNE